MPASSDMRSIPRREPPKTNALIEFLAVGGGTLLALPLFGLMRAVLGLNDAELAVGFAAFYGAHVLNDPHFAVTYQLFYGKARKQAFAETTPLTQKLRLWFAGLAVPLLLVGALLTTFVLQKAAILGGLYNLMFLLVSWHYVKQGFGVLVVISARRGVRFSKLERRILLGHSFAGWAFAWATPAFGVRTFFENGVSFRSLPHPLWLEQLTFAPFALSAAAVAWLVFRRLRARAARPPAAAMAGFFVSIWLWTVFPDIDPLLVYVIPAFHSMQYLYFVWLLRDSEARTQAGPPKFKTVSGELLKVGALAAVLGWLLFHGLPSFLNEALILQDPSAHKALGATPYVAAFILFVNLHHYFMDNVIWRRESPAGRHLVPAPRSEAPSLRN